MKKKYKKIRNLVNERKKGTLAKKENKINFHLKFDRNHKLLEKLQISLRFSCKLYVPSV